MEEIPGSGGLLEFTYEAETRPMTTLDTSVTTRLQELAAERSEVHDPIFYLDEGLGSVGGVYQVDAPDATTAARLGSALFNSLLKDAGVERGADALEWVKVRLFYEDSLYLHDIYSGGRYS